jgi:hypothetical protein
VKKTLPLSGVEPIIVPSIAQNDNIIMTDSERKNNIILITSTKY